jgi:hypothetical protein
MTSKAGLLIEALACELLSFNRFCMKKAGTYSTMKLKPAMNSSMTLTNKRKQTARVQASSRPTLCVSTAQPTTPATPVKHPLTHALPCPFST